MNHHPISQANKREQQTQQRRIQQVAGNPRWRFTNKTPQDRELRERRLYIQREQRHSEGKRCQLEPEDVKRQQKILQLHCKRGRRREGTPAADFSAKCGQ